MTNDFAMDHLTTAAQRKIAQCVVDTLTAHLGRPPYPLSGCRAFYTPKEWAARREEYGTNSKLILAHDGGDLAPFCNHDYCNYNAMEALREALEKIGFFVEQCTSWYSAVYPLDTR